jgi:hypothetical protein
VVGVALPGRPLVVIPLWARWNIPEEEDMGRKFEEDEEPGRKAEG